MKLQHRFIIPKTGQVADVVVEIDQEKLIEHLAVRCLLNKTNKTTAFFGHIKAAIVEAKQ